MGNVLCRDIFNAVFINVRESYISSLYTTKTKSKIVGSVGSCSEVSEEDDLVELNMKTSRANKDVTDDINEFITEKIERQEGSDITAKIRSDIEEKFPFAMGAVCSNLATLDREYRKFKGFDEQAEFSEFIIETTDEFPLSDRFAFPCIMFVSSMVLIDIDEKKSDDFYEKYASAVAQIVSELSYETSSTVEKYPY